MSFVSSVFYFSTWFLAVILFHGFFFIVYSQRSHWWRNFFPWISALLLISVLISGLFEVPLELESPTQISLVDEASGEVRGLNVWLSIFSDMSIISYINQMQNRPFCLLFCCIFVKHLFPSDSFSLNPGVWLSERRSRGHVAPCGSLSWFCHVSPTF